MPRTPEQLSGEPPEQKLENFLNRLTMNPEKDRKAIASLSEADLLSHYQTLQAHVTDVSSRLRAGADRLNRSAQSQTLAPWNFAGGANVRILQGRAEDLNYQGDYMWSIIGFLGDEIETKRKLPLPPSMKERGL